MTGTERDYIARLLDLGHGTWTDVTARLVLVGSAFIFVDLLLQLILYGPITRVLVKRNVELREDAKSISRAVNTIVIAAISSLHVAIQLPVAVMVLADKRLAADPVHASSRLGCFMNLFSAGYFMYDVAQCMFRYEFEGLAFLAHALASLAVFTWPLFTHKLQWLGALILLWELSTPFVNARAILAALHGVDCTPYLVNGVLMVFAFFCARIVYGTYSCFVFWRHMLNEALYCTRPDAVPGPIVATYLLLNGALCLLNFFWFHKMVAGAVKLLAARSGAERHVLAEPVDEGSHEAKRKTT